MDPNRREHIRQAIDAEINSLKASFRESLRALSQRRNEVAPISSLPTEVIADIILLASAERDDEPWLEWKWLNVARVCRQWRDIALNQPLFWSHINFTNLTLAGAAEMLTRAKKAPLHLEAKVTGRRWNDARYSAFNKELQAHVSHIRHLNIIGTSAHLSTTLQHALVASPAPILEYLSLTIPDAEQMVLLPKNIFEGATLYFLELQEVIISWKSPLLRGLRYLKIYELNVKNRPSVTDWLDALDEMPQLKELVLHAASPLADGFRFPSDVKRTATLPVLSHLDLSSTAGACALALAHLVLPALTCLIVDATSIGSDDLILFQYVTQHVHGPQDAKPLQSVFIGCDDTSTHIVAWPMPDIRVVVHRQPWEDWLEVAKCTVRVVLSIAFDRSLSWRGASTSTEILNAAMDALPLDSLVTLTVHHCIQFDEQVWLHHAPRWPLLENVHLVSDAACGLSEMLLLEDNGGHKSPLLPSLRKLELIGKTSLNKHTTLRLRDALKKRAEQGVPLQVLDFKLGTCKWTVDAIRLLRTFVDEVRGPKGNTSWQGEGPSVRDPETCVFFDSDQEDD
jgi:hypothetical protein